MPEQHKVVCSNAEAPVETIAVPVKMKAGGATCQEGKLANDTKTCVKDADKPPLAAKGVAREDETGSPKKVTRAVARPRQQHHHHMRKPGGNSQSSRLMVARPLNSGSTRNRPRDYGFSTFFEHCKRVLAAASYRGSAKNPLDALGVVFLPFLAASFPLERYFLRRQTSSRGGTNSRTSARRTRAIDDQAAASDAVLLSVDKETRKARCTTVKIGAGNRAAAGAHEPRAPVAEVCDADPNKSPQPRQGGKLAEQAMPVPQMPHASHMVHNLAGLLGPTLVPTGRTCLPEQQRCPRFGRGFLAIRHSASVYQTEEWKPRGSTLYLPLTNDVMINALLVDQLSLESGQFFLANNKGLYIGAKSGHAIHFWRYDRAAKKLYISQSVVFLSEQDYMGVLQQLECI